MRDCNGSEKTFMKIVRSKKLCIENLQSGLLLQTEAELRAIIDVSFRLMFLKLCKGDLKFKIILKVIKTKLYLSNPP